jgi:hypothetical protein
MFSATFCFLGIASLLVAALVCLSRAKGAARHVEVDIDALHAASVCISAGRRGADHVAGASHQEPTGDEKAKWHDMKSLWMQCYAQCQEKAILKQKALYSWARTLALCAALSLVGALLEVTFDKRISVAEIAAGFTQSCSAATSVHGPNCYLHRSAK